MLEIRNRAGMALELVPDEQLTIEINSTIFDTDDIIRGSYSYPFKMPLNDNNCRFIDNGHLPEKGVSDVPVSVTAGVFSFNAILTYKTSGVYADASLLIDLGAVADTIRNVPLRQYVTERFLIGTIEGGALPTLRSLALAPPCSFPVVFPPFVNNLQVDADFKPSETYVKPRIQNKFSPDNSSYSNVLFGSGENIMVPMIYVNWLISHVCQKLGFAAQGSLFADEDLNRLIIFNTQSTPGHIDGTYTVEIGRHIGDITISAFLKAIRSYMGVSIDINTSSKKATFHVYRSMRSRADYVDVTDELVAGTEGVERVGAGGYLVNVGKDDLDGMSTGRSFDGSFWVFSENATESKFKIGTGEVEVKLQISTTEVHLVQVVSNSTYTSNMMLPTVSMPGNLADPFFEKSKYFSPYTNKEDPNTVPDLVNDFGLRFLIYWGMQQDDRSSLYPYASALSYDSKYKVFGKLSLRPGEPDDIWNRYQKKYYEFLAYSSRASAVLKLSLAKLGMISVNDPVGLRFKNHVTGRYILEKLSYELPSQEGYVLAKFEGRQLNPKILKATLPADDLFKGVWVKFVIENYREEQFSGYSNQYGDVVLLTSLDGNFTIPAENENLIVNYKVANRVLNANGDTTVTYKNESLVTSQARTVLHSNFHLSTSIFYGGWKLHNAWIIQNGTGYRTRI